MNPPSGSGRAMGGNPRHFRQERREFIRVRERCKVTYRLLGRDERHSALEPLEGFTENISGGGMKLVGPLPNPDWIAEMLLGRMAVGVAVELPDDKGPVSALARTAWVEVADRKKQTFLLGLRFREISREDRERIVQFVIKSQLP
ncbi:MAG: PilZ domain-containing protein [Planctomycetota bacterium]|jgi:c-di-GMP-binding flagellar brake protein YcgR